MSKKSQIYLTKSLFKLSLECPTKLFYKSNKEYFDKSNEDSFLKSLADGGYQIGELAKVYNVGGKEIKSLDNEKALKETAKLIKNDNIILYEPAFRLNDCFVRVDILIKENKRIEIIEVKSKAFSGIDASEFYTKKGEGISKTWIPYLYDIAFQTYVLSALFKDYEIDSYLMLPDKNSKASIDGLNSMFKIVKQKNGIRKVETNINIAQNITKKDLLIKVKVNEIVKKILDNEIKYKFTLPFEDYIKQLAENVKENKKIAVKPHTGCAACQFKTDKNSKDKYKSGYSECWKKIYEESGYSEDEDTILELWSYGYKQDLLNRGIYFLRDLNFYNIFEFGDDTYNIKDGLNRKERQWIQAAKCINKDDSPYISIEGLKKELESVKYPLHFIDFETTMSAIPFFKGMRPFEGIGFQFSHHIMYEDGTIEHAGQFLNAVPGVFPNFDFVRNLKNQLEKDEGTIFCYSQHENSYLNIIFNQIYKQDEKKIKDKNELLEWIKTITHSSHKSPEKWKGERDMFDMLEMIKKYYYNPHTHGSNSIKYVLPAVLVSSEYLQKKYSKPVYGSKKIKSLNFKNQTWVKTENGDIINPYKLLPELSVKNSSLKKIAEGGNAMSAYSVLQHEDLHRKDRIKIEDALLKYCELDTFSMVVIWEYFRKQIIKSTKNK